MKVLADASIWIDHLRQTNRGMSSLLRDKAIRTHPFVVGELVCGNLADRPRFLADLLKLPGLPILSFPETLTFVELHKLQGLGMGWVDVSLLASAKVSGFALWTRDKALHRAAEKLRIAFYS